MRTTTSNNSRDAGFMLDRTLRSRALLAPVLALLLSACGGGGEQSSPTGSSAAVAAYASAGGASDVAAGQLSVETLTVEPSTAPETAVLAVRKVIRPTADLTALPETPYRRLVLVDPSAVGATDSGPGTVAAPYKTIAAAMTALQPGDDVVIAAGTYREPIVVPARTWGSAKTRIRAIAPRTVMIKGSTLVGGWTVVSSGVYAISWPGEEPQMVFNGGVSLQQIGGTVFGGYPTSPTEELRAASAVPGSLWPGRVVGDQRSMSMDSFYFDAAARRLYVRVSSPISSAQALEVSSRRHVFLADAATGLTVEGLDFAHANTSFTYRWGAVKVMGSGNTLNDITVRDMDGVCVQLIGDDSALSNSTIDRCGQVGVTGRGQRLRFEGNQILRGNTRGFDIWWEAGGMKLVSTGATGDLSNSVIRNNTVAYNNGSGIWIDWKHQNNLIEGNTAAYNTGFGIHYEASQTATIQNNLTYGNGLRGIYLMESSNCLVQGNAVFGNAAEGIGIVNGTRSASDPALAPYGNRVIGNTIAWNDFNRNWVQLVLPGVRFGAVSDRNALIAEVIAPRASMEFVSGSNPAYERLAWWQAGTTQDAHSTTETTPMPAALRLALSSKRLLLATELPSALAKPGT